MRVEVEQHGAIITIGADEDDLTVGEVVEGFFRPILRALGYHDVSIKRSIGDIDEEALSTFYERSN